VDTILFRKRSILLMKSGEVKTKKQNYLAFSPTLPIRRNFPDAILPGPLFFILAFLDIMLLDQVHFPEHLTNISWAYGDTSFPIRTDRIVQPLGLNQKTPPSHGLVGWGEIQ